MRRFRRSDNLLIRGVQPAVTDIFHDSSVEQPGILQHHAEQFPQFTSVKIFDIMAVDQDLTGIDVVEPHQQFDHGRLAGTCRADDCHLLPRFYRCGEIMDNDFVRIISKGSVADFHIAVNMAYICRVFHNLLFLRNIQKFKDPLGCGS